MDKIKEEMIKAEERGDFEEIDKLAWKKLI